MRDALQRDLDARLDGEVRFDKISRALYSTDAASNRSSPSVWSVVKSRDDILNTIINPNASKTQPLARALAMRVNVWTRREMSVIRNRVLPPGRTSRAAR